MNVDSLGAWSYRASSAVSFNSGLQLAALFSAGSVISASRGFAAIIRLALVVAT